MFRKIWHMYIMNRCFRWLKNYFLQGTLGVLFISFIIGFTSLHSQEIKKSNTDFVQNQKIIEKEISNKKIIAMSLAQAEQMFANNNLALLAAKFQIDVSRAGIIQAKLFANPSISFDQSIFNNKTDRYIDFTRSGQTLIQIQQLFLLGGKIDKRIKVAEIGLKISEQLFFDLLRALKFELRKNFFSLHYLRESLNYYERSIIAFKETAGYAEQAYKKGAILEAEVLRIKALLFFLENEKTDVLIQIKQLEANLRVLLNNPELDEVTLVPAVDFNQLNRVKPDDLKISNIIEEAIENRPDLKIAIHSLRYEQANLELEKAKAIPDLSFGPYYDRSGSYIPNSIGFTAQLNIPIFDRNEGNIEAAEKSVISRRNELQNFRLQAENEIEVAFNRLNEKERIYRTYKDTYIQDYQDLAGYMFSNYEKGYLTIIEFADFFETYRTSIIQMIRLRIERVEAIENLNYNVGKDLLKIQPEMIE